MEKVAVIGAGPAGIATLYEFLHTNRDGTSSVGGARSPDPSFKNIVVFEQKNRAGGIWAPSFDEAGIPFPPQDLLDTERYHDPNVIHPRNRAPGDLSRATKDHPVKSRASKRIDQLEWSKSGIFDTLFTNVPNKYTRFSYMPDSDKYHDPSRVIYPFLSQQELRKRIDDFIDSEHLYDYIRLNSTIEKVEKINGKWVVEVRQRVGDEDQWYSEQFDGIVVAVGHYTVPSIPRIDGLAQYSRTHPGVFSHANSFRSPDQFKDLNVVVVGSSISTTNLVQYIQPLARRLVVSKRSYNNIYPWINTALGSPGISVKPTIEKFLPETSEIVFADGSVEKDIDRVLFTTGYHYHFPFLTDNLNVNSPSNHSRVAGLYYNTFSIDDPTLASVGIAVSPLTFHSIEASAAAIAGVWSGAKKLPSKQVQNQWEQARVLERGDSLMFHFYPFDAIKEKFVDPIIQYAPTNRRNPLEHDIDSLDDIRTGVKNLEQLFYGLKNGTISVNDTLIDVD